MPENASNLNSGDSFVLLTPSDAYTWVGRSCAEEEVAVAEGIAEVMDHPCWLSSRRVGRQERALPMGFVVTGYASSGVVSTLELLRWAVRIFFFCSYCCALYRSEDRSFSRGAPSRASLLLASRSP